MTDEPKKKRPRNQRQVSVRGETYRALRDYCKAKGYNTAQTASAIIDGALAREGVAP